MVLIVLPIVGDVGGSPRRLPVVLGGWRCFRRLRMEAWRLAGTSNRSRSSSPSSSSSSSTSSEDELEEHGPSSLRVTGRYLLLLHSSFSTLVRANEGTISDSLRFPFPFPFPFHDSSSRLFFLRLSPSRLCLDSSSSASVLRTLDPAREAGADLQTTLVWLTFPSVVPARCSRTCAHSNGGRLCSLGLFVGSDNVELVFCVDAVSGTPERSALATDSIQLRGSGGGSSVSMMSSAVRSTVRREEQGCAWGVRWERRETFDEEGRLARGWMFGADAICRRYAWAFGASLERLDED